MAPSIESSVNVEPIAVIGFGLKFPQQASTPEGFWELLKKGASARTEVPLDRYNAQSFSGAEDSSQVNPGNVSESHFPLYKVFLSFLST